MRHEYVDLDNGDRPGRVERAVRAICSGRFHAIVLSDPTSDNASQLVEQWLGLPLQTFVKSGGLLAVTSCDCSLVLPILHQLFGVAWQFSGYYRTTWAAAPDNAAGVAASLPARLANLVFSAKCTSLKAVPVHERLFGTTAEARTQSLVPMMSGKPVDRRPDGVAQEYDVNVAVHAYGRGALALFGDVNMEPATVQLVLGVCAVRSPESPPDDVAALEPREAEEAMALKEKGNALFVAADFAAAAEMYQAAVEKYSNRAGAVGAQRQEYVKLLSNLSECWLRMGEWEAAASSAAAALCVDRAHGKSLLRHARAAEKLGALDVAAMRLRAAVSVNDETLLRAASALLRPIEHAMRREQAAEREKQRRQADGFRRGFASAIGGRGDGDGGGGSGGGGLPGTQARAPDRARSDEAGQASHGSGGYMDVQEWAHGLGARQYEWLCDCYRMRVDDDATWRGGYLHGLYAEEPIAADFLVFCKMAAWRSVVPPRWDWAAFLCKARELLRFAFEKADAKQKWGRENVFSVLTGGRSLRATGEVIYDSSVMSGDGAPALPPSLRLPFETLPPQQALRSACADVGGVAIWNELARAIDGGGDLAAEVHSLVHNFVI